MNCYKCFDTEGLSVKARNKNGHTRYICKACRRSQYYEYQTAKETPKPVEPKDPEAWLELYKQRELAILTKYGNGVNR